MHTSQNLMEVLAEFASTTRYEDIPQRIVEKIKLQIITSMTAETLSTFPQLGQVLFRMSAKERRKIIEHLKALSNTETSVKSVVTGAGNLLFRSFGKTLLKGLWKGKSHPIRLSDVHLAEYRMLQSARVTIHLEDGKRAVSEFPIPTGGSGMDWEVRKKWVATGIS